MDGLSNFQITKIVNRLGNKDLNENFVAVFPSDKMSRFFILKK